MKSRKIDENYKQKFTKLDFILIYFPADGDEDDDENDNDIEESDEETDNEESGDDDEDEDVNESVHDNDDESESETKTETPQNDLKSNISNALKSIRNIEKPITDDSGVSEDESESDSESEFKTDLARQASDAFYQRQSGSKSLRKIVYEMTDEMPEEKESKGNDDEIGGLFRKVSAKKKSASDEIDCSRFKIQKIHDWDLEETRQLIQVNFIEYDDFLSKIFSTGNLNLLSESPYGFGYPYKTYFGLLSDSF